MAATSTPRFEFPERIAVGDTVVISGGDTKRLVVVKKNNVQKLCKCNVDFGSLVGQLYGSVVELDEKARKFVPSKENPDLDRSSVDVAATEIQRKDNRNLDDTHGANQTLDQDKLAELKATTGVKGLVDKLVEQSKTFETKTAFAQEKYVRKKQAKYALLFKVERMTIDNYTDIKIPTCNPDTQESPDDSKALQIRIDSIAQILHYGSIRYNSRLLLVDDTNGILPAAILSRMTEEGQLYHALQGKSQPQMSHAKAMHLPDVKKRWTAIPFDVLTQPEKYPELSDEAEEAKRKNKKIWGDEENRQSQWLGGRAANALLTVSPVETLIVAKLDPLEEVVRLLPFVSLSGTIVAYSPCAEPLYRLFNVLKCCAVNIRVADTWYREYQVLPQRTHPTVTMSGTGGFILSATKIEGPLPVITPSPVSSTVQAVSTEDVGERSPKKARTE